MQQATGHHRLEWKNCNGEFSNFTEAGSRARPDPWAQGWGDLSGAVDAGFVGLARSLRAAFARLFFGIVAADGLEGAVELGFLLRGEKGVDLFAHFFGLFARLGSDRIPEFGDALMALADDAIDFGGLLRSEFKLPVQAQDKLLSRLPPKSNSGRAARERGGNARLLCRRDDACANEQTAGDNACAEYHEDC
jgi:hypothetical protein